MSQATKHEMRGAGEKCIRYYERTKEEYRNRISELLLVPLESARWSELTKFVANHIFRHIDRQECATIVNVEVEPNEIRSDGGAAGPSLDRLAIAIGLCYFDLLGQMWVNEETFFNGT